MAAETIIPKFIGRGRLSEFIFDGPGADTIYAGQGRDVTVLVPDHASDTVHCGVGHDVVWGAKPGANTIAADCEELIVGQPPRSQG